MKWKNRATAILLILAAFFLFAVVPGRNALFLLLFLAALFLLGGMQAAAGGRKLKMELELPETVEKRREFSGKLKLENRSLFPVYGNCTVRWKNELTGEAGKKRFSFFTEGKHTATIPFEGKSACCGKIIFKGTECFSCDPGRIFWSRRKNETQMQILVFPEITEFKTEFCGKERYDMESLEYSKVRKGEDVNETFDLREYQPGDNMHRVHWKLSEKLGKLMIREPGYPVKDRVLILLETGCKASENPKGQEAAAELTVSLLNSLLKQGIGSELGIFDHTEDCFQKILIEREEDLFEAEQLLISAGRKEGPSVIWSYLENQEEKTFSNGIYITADTLPEELYLLKEHGTVSVLCFAEAAEQSFDVQVLSAENWKEQIGKELLLGE